MEEERMKKGKYCVTEFTKEFDDLKVYDALGRFLNTNMTKVYHQARHGQALSVYVANGETVIEITSSPIYLENIIISENENSSLVEKIKSIMEGKNE